MKHTEHLSLSWQEFLANKSLFGVLLLSAIAAFFLVIVFFVIDVALLMAAIPGAIEGTPEMLLAALLSPDILLPASIILLVEAVLVLIVDAFFKAGFYGMVKNIARDGGTRFQEFFPEAKRFFITMASFQLIKSAIIGVLAIPLVVLIVDGLSSGFDTSTILAIVVAGLVFVAILIVVSILFIYGEVAIVMREIGAWAAIKETSSVVTRNIGTTLLAVLIAFGIMAGLSIVQEIFTAPFDIMAESTGQEWLTGISGFFSLIFNLVFIAAGIVISLYILHVYGELTDGARRPRTARKPRRA